MAPIRNSFSVLVNAERKWWNQLRRYHITGQKYFEVVGTVFFLSLHNSLQQINQLLAMNIVILNI